LSSLRMHTHRHIHTHTHTHTHTTRKFAINFLMQLHLQRADGSRTVVLAFVAQPMLIEGDERGEAEQ